MSRKASTRSGGDKGQGGAHPRPLTTKPSRPKPSEIIKGPWTQEEDDLLRQLIRQYGPTKWTTIATHLQGRVGKQCRERWVNFLDPAIRKDPWTHEEDLLLGTLRSQYGNRWADISKEMKARGYYRTDNAIKNRWNSSYRRQNQLSGENLDLGLQELAIKKSETLDTLTFINQADTKSSDSTETEEATSKSEDLDDAASQPPTVPPRRSARRTRSTPLVEAASQDEDHPVPNAEEGDSHPQIKHKVVRPSPGPVASAHRRISRLGTASTHASPVHANPQQDRPGASSNHGDGITQTQGQLYYQQPNRYMVQSLAARGQQMQSNSVGVPVASYSSSFDAPQSHPVTSPAPAVAQMANASHGAGHTSTATPMPMFTTPASTLYHAHPSSGGRINVFPSHFSANHPFIPKPPLRTAFPHSTPFTVPSASMASLAGQSLSTPQPSVPGQAASTPATLHAQLSAAASASLLITPFGTLSSSRALTSSTIAALHSKNTSSSLQQQFGPIGLKQSTTRSSSPTGDRDQHSHAAMGHALTSKTPILPLVQPSSSVYTTLSSPAIDTSAMNHTIQSTRQVSESTSMSDVIGMATPVLSLNQQRQASPSSVKRSQLANPHLRSDDGSAPKPNDGDTSHPVTKSDANSLDTLDRHQISSPLPSSKSALKPALSAKIMDDARQGLPSASTSQTIAGVSPSNRRVFSTPLHSHPNVLSALLPQATLRGKHTMVGVLGSTAMRNHQGDVIATAHHQQHHPQRPLDMSQNTQQQQPPPPQTPHHMVQSDYALAQTPRKVGSVSHLHSKQSSLTGTPSLAYPSTPLRPDVAQSSIADILSTPLPGSASKEHHSVGRYSHRHFTSHRKQILKSLTNTSLNPIHFPTDLTSRTEVSAPGPSLLGVDVADALATGRVLTPLKRHFSEDPYGRKDFTLLHMTPSSKLARPNSITVSSEEPIVQLGSTIPATGNLSSSSTAADSSSMKSAEPSPNPNTATGHASDVAVLVSIPAKLDNNTAAIPTTVESSQ